MRITNISFTKMISGPLRTRTQVCCFFERRVMITLIPFVVSEDNIVAILVAV